VDVKASPEYAASADTTIADARSDDDLRESKELAKASTSLGKERLIVRVVETLGGRDRVGGVLIICITIVDRYYCN
jgi:hypothetical protein